MFQSAVAKMVSRRGINRVASGANKYWPALTLGISNCNRCSTSYEVLDNFCHQTVVYTGFDQLVGFGVARRFLEYYFNFIVF